MSRYRNRGRRNGSCCRNGNGCCNRSGYDPCYREDDDNVIIIPDVPFVPVIGERSPSIFGWSRYEPTMHVYRSTPLLPFMCGCCCVVQEEEE